MTGHDRTPTPDSDSDSAPSEFTEGEEAAITEAVAEAVSLALGGVLCRAKFFPEEATFIVKLARCEGLGAYH